MDKIDQQLIHVLRRDGRISISDLSSRMGLSRATGLVLPGAIHHSAPHMRLAKAVPLKIMSGLMQAISPLIPDD